MRFPRFASVVSTLALAACMSGPDLEHTDAPGPGESDESTEMKKLLKLELGAGRSVSLSEVGGGRYLISESRSMGERSLLDDEAPLSSLAALVQAERPGEAMPEVLRQAAARSPRKLPASRPARQGSLGVIEQAVTPKEFVDQYGCRCNGLGDVVKPLCLTNETGNAVHAAEAEWGRFQVGHYTGNGIDAFVKVAGKATEKKRVNPGQIESFRVSGPDALFGDIDDVRITLDIKGAEGDRYHVGGCWLTD